MPNHILESCVNVNGTAFKLWAPITDYQFVFWPKLECSEPDVLLHLKDKKGKEYLVCIEAKFWSDKSSKEDQTIDYEDRVNAQRDQLAREIEDIHKESCFMLMNINRNQVSEIILIYLTNHTYRPSDEMLESLQFVKGSQFQQEQLYWLTWREIHNVISKIMEFQTPQDKKLIKDLKSLLERKGLQCFNGFRHHLVDVPRLNTKYATLKNRYEWNLIQNVSQSQWNYGGLKYV